MQSQEKTIILKFSGGSNSSWISRNMIFSGAFLFLHPGFFSIIHFIDFWIPEMNYKYVEVLQLGLRGP